MRTSSRKVVAGALTTSVIAVLGTTVLTAPSAVAKGAEAPAKIKMVIDGGPVFTGDSSVAPGQGLKIINKTKVQDIGPHTFSLIEEGSLPTSGKELKKCAKIELPVCVNVFKAHDVSKKFVVRKPNVDKGAEGWDRSFSEEVKGDTWYTEQKGESETRAVTAAPGSTLYYFCLVHPEMQGSLNVESE
ncbi:MAG TPA: hypothetical protein VD766_11980 [Solirubrobacterales bacterium]|nr:hypothetical protein [Solirubrobacterales bacterium]